LSTGKVRLISETFWLVRGLSAPFAWFQLNLTSDNAPIYHPQRWDEEKLASKRSVSQPSRKGTSYNFKPTLEANISRPATTYY
jgi:hypothetical protein